jgi:hypothetical protein
MAANGRYRPIPLKNTGERTELCLVPDGFCLGFEALGLSLEVIGSVSTSYPSMRGLDPRDLMAVLEPVV